MTDSPGKRIAANQFSDLFTQDRVLIDTRAPIEFEKGSFPTAINAPLMSDLEREQVGNRYAQMGPEAAIVLGHELVSGKVKDARISHWLSILENEPEAALFCFRGGLRSQTTQAWLAARGLNVPIVDGGYKALRRFLIDSLEPCLDAMNIVVVAGRTGVAKTALLNQCEVQPQLVTIDLEGLANHRGSAFGKRIDPQPTQINFENAVAIAFLQARSARPKTVAIEDESRLIGRCALPLPLQACIGKAPVVTIEATLAERVDHSWENYILQNHEDLVEAYHNEEQAFEVFADSLRSSLQNIRKRLGGTRYSELSALLEDAIKTHRQGDAASHKAWIEILLRDYYDPMYDYQLKSKQRRIVFSGNFEEVINHINQ